MRKIEPKFLISEDLADITKEILKEDQVIDIYLHNKIGTTVVLGGNFGSQEINTCLLYTSPSPRDGLLSRMPSSA